MVIVLIADLSVAEAVGLLIAAAVASIMLYLLILFYL
jgi:hypothetical protein